MKARQFFDLLEIGMVVNLGSHTFEREEVVTFAREFDPHPFHLDEEEALKRNFEGICASGWQIIATWMRLNIEKGHDELLRLTGFDGPFPQLGPSPGVRNIRWLKPVYVGQTIRFSNTIIEKRTNLKRPGWALVGSRCEGFDADGERVMRMDGAALYPYVR